MSDQHLALAEYNRLRHASGHPPSTSQLVAAIADRLAHRNPRPSEHPSADAGELARAVFDSLPLDECAAIAIADGDHPGHLHALARAIANRLQFATDFAERATLEAAHADLMRAVAAASGR